MLYCRGKLKGVGLMLKKVSFKESNKDSGFRSKQGFRVQGQGHACLKGLLN